MSASPISEEVAKARADWRRLWYAMADNDAAQYLIIKSMSVREFWTIFDQWKDKVDAQAEARKKSQKK